MKRRTTLALALLLACAARAPYVSAQPAVESLGERRLADARMFVDEGEWDAALFALEEASWYFPEGDTRLAELESIRGQARFGKSRARGDAAADAGDLEGAIRHWEQALRHQRDAGLQARLDDAQAQLAGAPPPPDDGGEGTPPRDGASADGGDADALAPPTDDDDTPPADLATGDDDTPAAADDDDSAASADAAAATDGDDDSAAAAPTEPVPPPNPPDGGDGGDGIAAVEPVFPPPDDGTAASSQAARSIPWVWILAIAGVVALGVVGTRPSVLAALAGGLQTMGMHPSALAIYERLVPRVDDPALRRAYVESLAATRRVDADARRAYRAVLDDALPDSLLLHLAALYWERGITDGEAPKLYELATARAGDDADLWEALEACIGEDDERRLRIAKTLIAMGRPTPDRLLRVAEQWTDGEPSDELRTAIAEVAALDSDDEAIVERRDALIDRLLPVYRELELSGDDAIAVREAALMAVERSELRPGSGHRMCGDRARHARAVLHELSRTLRAADDPDRLLRIYERVLRRFPGEAALLDGLLQAAGERSAYGRVLELVDDLYPRDESTDAALKVRIALEFMVAGGRHLRERAHESGAQSADLPSLTFFEVARSYLDSIGRTDVFRPDVREQLALFVELYLQSEEQLLALDAVLARLLWGAGDHPTAIALFFWACGFEPHFARNGVLLLPGDRVPPDAELFPDDRSTLAVSIADRAVQKEDVDEIVERARQGTLNSRIALLVSGQPLDRQVRLRAMTRATPVIPMVWDDLLAALEGSHARQTFRRLVGNVMRYGVPPEFRDRDLEDARLFGREDLIAELERRFADRPTGKLLVVSGLRGVGKSTLVSSCLRSAARTPAAIIRPDPEPDIYVPGLWMGMLGDLFASARAHGIVPAPERAPTLTPEPAPGDPSTTFTERFSGLLAAIPAGNEDHSMVVGIDPVDDLFPVPDPLNPDPELGEGSGALIDALGSLAADRGANVVLLSRQVGVSSHRSFGADDAQLPEDCDELVVGLLDDEATRALFATLGEDLGVELDDTFLDGAVAAAGGHPGLAWLIGDTISAHRAQHDAVLGAAELEQVLRRVSGSGAFTLLASYLIADFNGYEQDALVALAACGDGQPDAAAISGVLGGAWTEEDVTEVLDGLARTTLVAHVAPDRYRLRVGLLRDWLAAGRPSLGRPRAEPSNADA